MEAEAGQLRGAEQEPECAEVLCYALRVEVQEGRPLLLDPWALTHDC